MSDKIKNFNHFQWYKIDEGIITIGINEEALEDITEITLIDIPPEQEKVDSDIAFGSLETDDGILDLMTPFAGTIIEVNTQVIEDPQMVIDDPYEEGWLVRIEATEDLDEDLEEDEDEDDEADDEDFEAEEDEADED
jgi:glycine cleavage system H protein